ncbi:MAG: aminoglycoside phosphotransferase family protein [Deltaproteobacteria bacterium]|nr:aminoglycoside phosphotransferase family protein [Deltaproteobacteria bacterium]
MGPDTGATRDGSAKAAGYGKPVRITLAGPRGERREVVFRTSTSDEFGHDRRADRMANAVLAFDDFPHVPRHIEALDVGAIGPDGTLTSIRGEPYVITSYSPGQVYAEDLRRVAREGRATTIDLERIDALARYLAELHAMQLPPDANPRYRRAIRDLMGHGEGIFGMIDGYPPVAGAPPKRLQAIERACVEWRWRLRDFEHRLTRTHGDFHPFNVVFETGTTFAVLDASRGTCGEPADDMIAMAINFLLFAADIPGAWNGLGPLWHRFWATYLRARPDRELTTVVPPFFAWRALVVCNPRFYPGLSVEARENLLGLAERALENHHFELGWADELFRGWAA